MAMLGGAASIAPAAQAADDNEVLPYPECLEFNEEAGIYLCTKKKPKTEKPEPKPQETQLCIRWSCLYRPQVVQVFNTMR